MTYDSKNYSGPGAVGAVPLPGRNAIGQPVTTGPNVVGADSPPHQTLSDSELVAYINGLERNPSATAGVTNLFDTSNGTVALTKWGADYIIPWAKLDQRGVVLIEPVIIL